MISNKEIRAKARVSRGDKLFSTLWVTLAFAVFIYFATVTTGFLGAFILMGPMAYGFTRLFINRAKGTSENVDLFDLLTGFKESFGESVFLGFFRNIIVMLWSCAFVVPGIIKAYSFALAPYIQQDEADKNWRRCLRKSQAMMKGNKKQLFCLDLSFIGWFLLGSLCCGVGLFWVVSYHSAARAHFYLDLKASYEGEKMKAIDKDVAASKDVYDILRLF